MAAAPNAGPPSPPQWGVSIVDAAGRERLRFLPGEDIYLQVGGAGKISVRIVDLSTGVLVSEKSLEAGEAGKYLLWRTSPLTTPGNYRVYVDHAGTPYVFTLVIGPASRRVFPLPYAVAAAAATVAVASALLLAPPYSAISASGAAAVAAIALYLALRGKPEALPPAPPVYYLYLPAGVRIKVDKPYMVYGRDFFARLGVPSDLLRYISRSHFAISYVGGRYYIEDLGSKNGTFLNGRPIKGLGAQVLNPGDIITVAQILSIKFVTGKFK
ncbi:FHA domain containing protein [Thermoproteus uzoniensis 768-20]|uniref:FHA domain containing protein n=1 Tax=Thermoproteus uzoniensis (strain 768-20) TaxID=999630 RepID=F2L5V9_THEU7|nr:FHA domain-containing protein [Thermoproteus uzoniensis]AEA12404.1 FHA domain containing protein [Thermoproteus uzoniensis 768-20]